MEQQTEALLKILELGEKEKENQDEVNSSNNDNSSLSSS